jgi:hypothetical protein
VTCLLVEGTADLDPAAPVAGLIVDEWNEVVPTRVRGPSGDASTRVTVGIAANVDAPNARAPQAILLAISPDGQRWTTEALVDVVTETLELAKIRSVTLERAPLIGRVLPATQEQSWSLQGEETLDLALLANEMFLASAVTQFVKD